jgi:hypothetical protein
MSGDPWEETAEQFEQARQAAERRQPQPDDGAADCLSEYVRRFLEEVQDRHGDSLQAMISRPDPFDIELDHSGVRLRAGAGEQPTWHTRVLSADFCVSQDGRWGFYQDAGDDYVPPTLVFGYDENNQFVDLRHNFANFTRLLSVNWLCAETLRVLVACARSDW